MDSSGSSHQPTSTPAPRRKKIIFLHGYQMRFAALVAGSLFVLLLFAGFHGLFVASNNLRPEIFSEVQPVLKESTIRLFAVGLMYILVVTMAAIFISHRVVGPAHRLEDEINKMAESNRQPQPLHVREGDEFEGLVGAVNKLVERIRGTKGS